MAIIKVKLKDASQNVLHPETDWSVVQDRPSFDRVKNNGNSFFTQKWDAAAKSDDVEIDGDAVNIYSKDTSISLESSEDISLISGGGKVYINSKRPFTVRHIMGIGGCEFEIFDDQDKELTMSDLKLISSSLSLPASGYDTTNKRIFYSVRLEPNGLYANYVKVTNGVLEHDTTNYGTNVTEVARYVLKW